MWLVTAIGLTVFLVALGQTDNSETLKFVHVLWRHGDRSPSETFPTDNNTADKWPQGFGELSSLGMAQQFELGQFLKQRYVRLVGQDYNASSIYVVSTSYNRTLMSALSNLAGMYPPTAPSGQTSPPVFDLWQPIPVHSRPREEDPMLWMDLPCPTFDNYFKQVVMKSGPVTKIMDDNKPLISFLRNVTGNPIDLFDDIWKIFDPLFCEEVHNTTNPPPAWLNASLMAEITRLYDLSTTFYYPTVESSRHRLRGGLLLGDIIDRMNWIANSTEAKLKYYAYSAHDTTLIALLEALGAYEGYAPPYASAMFVELHQINGRFEVQVYYRNSTTGNPIVIPVKNCPSPCSLALFTELGKPLVPMDFYAECGLASHLNAEVFVWQAALYAVSGLLLLALILVSVLLYKYTHAERPYGFSRVSTEDVDA